MSSGRHPTDYPSVGSAHSGSGFRSRQDSSVPDLAKCVMAQVINLREHELVPRDSNPWNGSAEGNEHAEHAVLVSLRRGNP